MNSLFDFVSHKHIFAILFTAMCVLEIRKGFLKLLDSYVKSLSLKPFLILSVLAAAVALLLMPFDALLLQKIQSVQNPILDQLILIGAFFGKNYGAWGPFVVLYLAALGLRSEKFQRFFFGGFLSSALTGLLAHILKFIMMRARPYKELGPYHFFDSHGYFSDVRAFESFPSGDVAVSAGAAVFLFLAFRKFYFRWVFLLIPLLTCLSRIDLNKHWPSDTVFSFLVSFAVAKFVWEYTIFLERHKDTKTQGT